MRDEQKGCAAVIAAGLALALVPVNCQLNRGNRQTHAGTVTQAYVKRAGSGEGSRDRYHVALECDRHGAEVFQVRDSVWLLRWDAADVNARLVPGRRLALDTAGYRVPLLSWFPNVVEARPDREPLR